jgi:beta-glucosidase
MSLPFARAARRVAASCLTVATLMVVGAPGAAGSVCGTHPWCNSALSPGHRAALVLAAMTQDEKLALVADGHSGDARLGIPALNGIDGPNGVGEANAGVTAFPDAETVAASWDTAIARAYGRALGAETAGKGYSLLFAPTVNIVRTPKWGREAETFGEDPFLTSALVAPEIQGIQSNHVIAQVKHYAGNNQEVDRFGDPLAADAVSDQVSERALQEIYLPAFRAAVQKGHVGSVMCSYNRINTLYSCQDPATLSQLGRFGLAGFVGPDAELAVRDEAAAANAGVDNFQLGSIHTAVGVSMLSILTNDMKSGAISHARLDDMALRILTAMFEVGLFDHPHVAAAKSVSTAAHRRLATRVAEQSTVLLRNRGGVLPLSPRHGSIAVIGDDAGAGTQIEENGSPAVLHGPVITPLAGIRARVGHRVRVSYARGTLGDVPLPAVPSRVLTPAGASGHGLSASYYTGQAATGTPVLRRVDSTVDFAGTPAPLTPIPNTPGATAARWTGELDPPATGLYRFSLAVSGKARLYVNGRLVVDANAEFASAVGGASISDPGAHPIAFQGLATLRRGHRVAVEIDYATGSSIAGASLALGWQPPDPRLFAAAVRAARHARTAIVFAGDVTSEGMDRPSLALPGDQDRLIEAVAAANPRTVVVLHTAGPVLMPWLPKVAGVLEAWYPGQQSGAAIAATVFGDADPSGRLPVTFPASNGQGPASKPSEYPGIGNVVRYDEGIFVGYRYYDRFHQRPLFPFGFGLSYTRFTLTHPVLKRTGLTRARVSVTVRNVGARAGAEVVEIYVGDPSNTGEPPHQLKAFAKVFLAAGRGRTVRLALPPSSFETYDASLRRWTVGGRYKIYLGTSSRQLALIGSIGIR